MKTAMGWRGAANVGRIGPRAAIPAARARIADAAGPAQTARSRRARARAGSTRAARRLESQVEHHLALARGRREAARLVEVEDRLDRLRPGRRSPGSGRGPSAEISPLPSERVAHPVEQPLPEAPSRSGSPGCAGPSASGSASAPRRSSSSVPKPPGTATKADRVLRERDLAREEVAERQRDVLVLVAALLVRQLDVQPDRRRRARRTRPVGRFHDAGAAAGDRPRTRRPRAGAPGRR